MRVHWKAVYDNQIVFLYTGYSNNVFLKGYLLYWLFIFLYFFFVYFIIINKTSFVFGVFLLGEWCVFGGSYCFNCCYSR